MKTPEQRAAKLAEKANECCYRSDGYEEDLATLICEQIKEAEIETVLRLCEGEDCFVAQKEREAYQRGFREAIEKAAEVAETSNLAWQEMLVSEIGYLKLTPQYEFIAKQIRALALKGDANGEILKPEVSNDESK